MSKGEEGGPWANPAAANRHKASRLRKPVFLKTKIDFMGEILVNEYCKDRVLKGKVASGGPKIKISRKQN